MKKRLTFLSDTHTKHDKLNGFLPGGDILIHAGDLTSRGYITEVENFMVWYDKINNYDHKVFIAGNHDFGFQDENEKWYDDNGIRSIFFCKGALETVKKFGWPPDIIHCSGWMTGLVPVFLKTAYKKEPVFSNSKVLFTLGQNTFSEKLGDDFLKLSMINVGIKEKDLEQARKHISS
jgi:glycogen synthase